MIHLLEIFSYEIPNKPSMSILLMVTSMSGMVWGSCVLNGSSGKLEVVMEKECNMGDSKVGISVDGDHTKL